MSVRKVAAIVQARMSSSRFPRKVLRPLADKPILWHVLERLKRCRSVDTVCVATSDSYEDDRLARLVSSWGYEVVRGPRDDVLARYAKAARMLEADYVVRVTSDAPLICPKTIDSLVELAVERNADYATGHKRSLHEGFEVISAPLLLWLHENTHERKYREHVTLFVREHPKLFNIAYLRMPKEYLRRDLHLSIDNYSDWELFEAIYRELWRPSEIVELDRALELIDSEPAIRTLNSHVTQKPPQFKPPSLAFRMDAGPTIGLGHLYRSYAVARWLNEVHHSPVWFLMKGDPRLFSTLRKKGYRTLQLPPRYNDANEAKELARFLKRNGIDILFIDVKHPYPESAIRALKREGSRVAAFDPPLDAASCLDLAVFPDASALFEIPDEPAYLRGPKFFPLRLELKRYKKPNRTDRSPARILLFGGGGDECDLTSLFLDALTMLKRDIEVALLLSSANPKRAHIASKLRDYPHAVHTFTDIDNPAALFAQADMALTAYGAIVYELAYFGVPTLTASHSLKNAKSESLAARLGFFMPLGYWEGLRAADIADELEKLLTDTQLAESLSQKARRVVDGKGAERIARAIEETEEKSHEQGRSSEVVSLPALR